MNLHQLEKEGLEYLRIGYDLVGCSFVNVERTSVDPVKAILSTSMWLAIAPPAVGPYPGIRLTTPGGKPA